MSVEFFRLLPILTTNTKNIIKATTTQRNVKSIID
jgi:hypothetical protein